MYEISDLWEHKRIDIATEHICSNIAHSLVKIINERVYERTNNKQAIYAYQIVNYITSVVISSESVSLGGGYRVFNICS